MFSLLHIMHASLSPPGILFLHHRYIRHQIRSQCFIVHNIAVFIISQPIMFLQVLQAFRIYPFQCITSHDIPLYRFFQALLFLRPGRVIVTVMPFQTQPTTNTARRIGKTPVFVFQFSPVFSEIDSLLLFPSDQPRFDMIFISGSITEIRISPTRTDNTATSVGSTTATFCSRLCTTASPYSPAILDIT